MSASPIPSEYFWIIYAGAFAFFFLAIAVTVLKNRGKIQVRIKTPLKEEIQWRKPVWQGQKAMIVMEKGTKKNPGWSFEFTNKSLVQKKGLLRSYIALDVFPKAAKAIEYDYGQNQADAPKLTKEEVQNFARMYFVKVRYGEKPEQKAPGILYVIAILSLIAVVLGIVNFLGTRGVRIG